MIGTKIRERRLELGMTQEDLANKMGFKSKTTITKVEMGINDVNQKRVVQYAKALNTTPAYLMGWEDEEKERLLIEQQILYKQRPCDNIIPIIDDLSEDEVKQVINYILFVKSQR